MSDNSSEQEPSIEEILASIRQIISDDDEVEVKKEDAVEVPLESPVHETSDDVLELTEEDLIERDEASKEDLTSDDVEETAEEAVVEEIIIEEAVDEAVEEVVDTEPEDVEIELRDRLEEIRTAAVDEPEPEPEIKEEPEMPPKNPVPSDILSSSTQAAALGSLNKLASKMPINNPRSYDGVTLEDIAREMLHPMLREWMDDNLPPMVERIVQKELEKLARRSMDD
jgi:cell pole-organizing protein PopZ